jgi:hypothetical protein
MVMRRSWFLVSILLIVVGCAGSKEPPSVIPDVIGPPFADLHQQSDVSPIGGVMAEGEAGDWVIQNERFSVVIQSLDHLGGFAASGGNIIDAAPNGGNDVLREVFTYFDNEFGRQAVYQSLEPGQEADSTAVSLVALGRDSQDSRIEVETRYILTPGSHFLEIVSTLTNTGSDSVIDFELGDAIEWGRAEFFAPGPGHALAGTDDPVPFLLGFAEGTAYAWVNPEGDCGGPHGHIWSDPIIKTVDLLPGETTSYRRRLIVERGSPSIAARMAWTMRGDQVGTISLVAQDRRKNPLEGVRVIARGPAGDAVAWGETSVTGAVMLPVPPGSYELELVHSNRGTTSGTVDSVGLGITEEAVYVLPEAARVALTAWDTEGRPSPVRWTFAGVDETHDPAFGPGYRISGAGNYVFTPNGRGEALVPPGKYSVTATRGPAYEIWERELDLDPGENTTLVAEMERLIPQEWVAADFHVHSLPSADCNVSIPDRARSLVCEGLDWFAATEHGRRTDYATVLDTLSLAAPLYALVSEEVTTSNWGHFGAFPLPINHKDPRRGGLDVAGMDLDSIFSRFRSDNPEALIQINHPRAGNTGYFDQVGYSSPDSSTAAMRLDFDLLEVLNGKNLQSLDMVWKDWMGLLRSGRNIVGVGNSDSHHLIEQEVGYPRNYVALEPGDSISDQEAFLAAVRAGRIVVSNGPFIDFTVDGVSIGSTVSVKRGIVKGHVRVIAPSWVDVSKVSVHVNGVLESVYMVKGNRGPVRFDEDIEINVKRPAFVVVRVEGEGSLAPILPPVVHDGRPRPVWPVAFTNPIWLEVSSSR